MMDDCLNNYKSIEEIENFFGESDESIKKCNRCPNLIYENGTMFCQKIHLEEREK